jgi:hypothetical protein
VRRGADEQLHLPGLDDPHQVRERVKDVRSAWSRNVTMITASSSVRACSTSSSRRSSALASWA